MCRCVCVLQHVGTVLWFLQQASFHDEAEHLLIGQALVGLLRQSGNLPQHNPERPTQSERWLNQPSILITKMCVCVFVLDVSAYQTSELVVNTPSLRDSGDIQRTGSRPLPPLR